MSYIAQILSQKIAEKREQIEEFFTKQFSKSPALLYNSVDLRHSGFKIAPVDTNCFSAGFNNLSAESKQKAEQNISAFIEKNFPAAKKIILIPENHTRNLLYLENVLSFSEIISKSCETIIGSLIPDLKEATTIALTDSKTITLHPIKKQDGKIIASNGFEADLVILNNDLTDGVPEILQNLKTPITPSPNMGWNKRLKSNHFTIYNQLATELAAIINIDPWLISSMHLSCENINFKLEEGIEELAQKTDQLLAALGEKYKEYKIDEQPYCFIKADNGTYGIAVWPVYSGNDILEINKKERNKMNMLKGSVQTSRVIIQEGIKTIDKINQQIAEPLIYLCNGQVVGNLFRINENRSEHNSLNASGMHFSDLNDLSQNQVELGLEKNKITDLYALIATLAAAAAAQENYS